VANPGSFAPRGRQNFQNLQILRFAAAFAVVLFHLFKCYETDFGFGRNYFEAGEFGVDIFFVISGFVITYTASPGNGIAPFASKRIARIVPLYWALTGLVALLTLLAPRLLNSTQFDAINLLKSLLFIPYQKENGLVQPILFLGWTLNYEMFFYLILGVSLRFGKFAPFAASLIILGLVSAGQVFPRQGVLWGFYTGSIMLEFMYGVLLCTVLERFGPLVERYGRFALLPATALFCVILFDGAAIPRPAGQGLIALAIVTAALSIRPSRAWIVSQLTCLGDASYSLYLSHVFVLQVFSKACKFYHPMPVLVAGSMLAIAACLALSRVLYTRFERPAQSWMTKYFASGSSAPLIGQDTAIQRVK